MLTLHRRIYLGKRRLLDSATTAVTWLHEQSAAKDET